MEHNLFGMRKELGMESEVVQYCQLAREREGSNEKRHKN